MKPDWKDAPEWANWLAMDEGGYWHWYQYEPVSSFSVWEAYSGKHEYAGSTLTWEDLKEKRPQQENNHV